MRTGKIMILAAFAAYPILLHLFIRKAGVDTLHLLEAFTPLLLAAIWLLLRSIPKAGWPFVIALFAWLIYYVATGENGRAGLFAVDGLSHAGPNLFMLWLFGRTLLSGREPLISQIARHINGDLEPEIAVYTRRVTIGWCIFFALQVIVSLSLYLFTPIVAWSFFINVMNLPLVIMMFVGEYSYRIARCPNHPRTSIVKIIEVYSQHFAAQPKTKLKKVVYD